MTATIDAGFQNCDLASPEIILQAAEIGIEHVRCHCLMVCPHCQ